jgi:hypothetical protein
MRIRRVYIIIGAALAAWLVLIALVAMVWLLASGRASARQPGAAASLTVSYQTRLIAPYTWSDTANPLGKQHKLNRTD